MARNKYLPDGTTYTIVFPFSYATNVGNGHYDMVTYLAGTVATVVGRKTRSDNGYRYTNYVVRMPDGKTVEYARQDVEKQHPPVI